MAAGAASQVPGGRRRPRTAGPDGAAPLSAVTDGHPRVACCGLYHRAVELVGKRWSGAILLVLLQGPMRFSEIGRLVPDVSDRLLSERLKELEQEGLVRRQVLRGSPTHVQYKLTEKGLALEPAVRALESWARDWLD